MLMVWCAARAVKSHQDDDVAKWWNGRPWQSEQSMDETYGNCAQGEKTPRVRRSDQRFHRQDTQSVSDFIFHLVLFSDLADL